MKTKICKKCRFKKDVKDFHKNISSKDKLSYWCKLCNRILYKEYYQINFEKIKNNLKEYNKTHQKQLKLYRLKNKEKINQTRKKWYVIHRKERLLYNKKYNVRIRNTILNHYGNKCTCCNETRREFLTIDHINNDGNIQRKKIGNSRFYTWIIQQNFPKDLQILCCNCNFAKGFYGCCPHTKEKK